MSEGGASGYIGTALAVASLLWHGYNTIRDRRDAKYESQYSAVESLIETLKTEGSAYWIADARDEAAERKMVMMADDLEHKLQALRMNKAIKHDRDLDMSFISFRQALMRGDFQSAQWQRDISRATDIRDAAERTLHLFLRCRH